MSAEKAREVRARGHADARRFARLIGLPDDYQNNPHAKKDVIDLNGDAHSVKSGKLKWQIFLYKESRFRADPGFTAMNGIGGLISDCLACHPKDYAGYAKNKPKYKEVLRPRMVALKERLSPAPRRRAFFEKAFFNGNEVNYLTVLHEGVYHVFLNGDVVRILSEKLGVKNSQALTVRQTAEQKTVFYTDSTIGEIELRRDAKHYISVKFWMFKEKTMRLLRDSITPSEQWSSGVSVYGGALRKFKRKHKEFLAA